MISHVTTSLTNYLRATVGDWVAITSLSNDATPPAADRLHVFLYSVEEHGHLRNRPLVPTVNGFERAPMSLRLDYLMAYWSNDHPEVQRRLERVLEAFHTTPIFTAQLLVPELSAIVDRLVIRLAGPASDERNQIWTALGRPMRLALYYQVDVAPIRLLERDDQGRGRVEQLDIVYGEVGA